jgi:hypothetical protein
MPDRFPEAFKRFEQDVDVEEFDNYAQLRRSFAHWAGKRWRDSYLQNKALKRQGQHLGFEDAELPSYFKPSERWKNTAQFGKHRGLKDKQISIMNDGIRKGNSANQILRQLRKEGLGIRRKELLRDIREMKMKSPRANPEKHIPRKYRK